MKKVLVIGDVIRDVFHEGSVRGISAESPTMVMQIEKTESYDGGAGLVRRHLENLDCDVTMWEERPRVTKTRFFVDGYKLFQTDKFHDERDYLFNHKVSVFFADIDVVVVADNRHGAIANEADARLIVEECKKRAIPLFVDSQVSQEDSNHHWYRGCDYMLMNEREAMEAGVGSLTGLTMRRFCEKIESNIIVKLGKDGLLACIDGKLIGIIGHKVDVVDTCGAGDAFLAKLVSCPIVDTQSLEEANYYAAQTCTYVGTKVI